ncbi:MAG TPA: hypothetical protein VHY08_10900, partial [Bacillota bacterium]|nr:hypothetical protein [Bacillota bacterium]
MAEIDGMDISFPKDYTEEERELILSAFGMANTETLEKKGFGEFVDLMMASPEMVIVTFVSGAIATGILRKLGGDIYDAVKKKLSEGFSKRVKAKARFVISLGNVELNVEFDIKNMDQLDFVFNHIIELIRKHENDGLAHEFQAVNYRVSADNNWEKIQPGQSSGETENKGVPGFQTYHNLYVFPQEETDSEQQEKVYRQEAIEDNPYSIAIIDINNQEEFEKMLELRKKVYIDELD